MTLAADVQRLKGGGDRPLDAATIQAAENVLTFLDVIVNGRDSLPRGYYHDVSGRGYEQVCLPVDVECSDDMTRVFAGDVASGFLEELAGVLDPQRAALLCLELGVAGHSPAVRDEGTWLALRSPGPMLHHMQGLGFSERSLRLFVCAAGRALLDFHANSEAGRRLLDVLERQTDGAAGPDDLPVALRQASEEYTRRRKEGEKGLQGLCAVLLATGSSPLDGAREVTRWAYGHESAAAAQAAALRCLFGNPFRPVKVEPAWRTADVLALARAAREEVSPAGHLDPRRLAILADALEEGGCTAAGVLEHLRGPGPHERGCFAVDCLLAR